MPNYVVSGEGTSKSLGQLETLTVTASGVINATLNAVTLLSQQNSVLNAGVLSSSSGDGIGGIACRFARIVNSGTILAPSAIVLSGQANDGIYANIINTGTITGATSSAIVLFAGGNQIHNEGHITSLGDTAIRVDYVAQPLGYDLGNLITNSGLISAYVVVGTAVAISTAADGDRVINSGTIRGAVNLGDGANNLENTGLIVGNVTTGAGGDTIVNHGRLDGAVLMGDGSNVFDGRGGSVLGYVQGGAGSDLYRISDGAIVLVEGLGDVDTVDDVQTTVSYKLEANFERLWLMGNEAINGTGNTELNAIYGNSADNRLSGLGGNDNLFGYEGDDRLIGGLGNDQLYGLDDDDILRGGFGADTLTGGDGADRFVFQTRADAPTATPDRIADFAQGVDVIDLGGLPGTLTFRGTAAFQAGGAQVRIVQGANTQVQIDLDGDLGADMKILLTGNIALQASDFIL